MTFLIIKLFFLYLHKIRRIHYEFWVKINYTLQRYIYSNNFYIYRISKVFIYFIVKFLYLCMKQQFVKAGTIIMVTAIIFGLNSCQDFDPTNEEVYVKTSFEKNFKSTFGEIDPNQSWDLTKTMPRTKKYNVYSDYGTTRATHAGNYDAATTEQQNKLITKPGTSDDHNGWYLVQPSTLTWMNNNLVEGNNNTSKGSAFDLVPLQYDFAIIPIYQGRAGLVWDLHLVDPGKGPNGVDYKLWSKSEGIQKKNNANDSWHSFDQTYDNGHTINATSVISQPLIINYQELSGQPIFLYLDITSGGNDTYAHNNTAQRSDEGMMLSLNCSIPTNLDAFTNNSGSQVMIVGAEDADLPGSDWDMNDVVFLIVGYPFVPDLIEFYHKRYLCEDLGNTYDFDFNDIVVDVNQTSYLKAVLTTDASGNKEMHRVEDMNRRVQTATISHLCGELPFSLTVGNSTFPTVTDPTDKNKTLTELASDVTTRATGWEPDQVIVTKNISGWDRHINNINIKVAKNPNDALILTHAMGTKVVNEDADKHYYQIDFPQNGEAPLIIAVDQTVNWMNEYEHIPETWWKEGKIFDPYDEPNWDYSRFPLNIDENGEAILNNNGLAFEWWGEFLFNSQSPYHANLLNAIDQGYTKLKVYFDGEIQGTYQAREGNTWNNVLINQTSFETSSNYITINLTNAVKTKIRGNGGMILIIQPNWNGEEDGHAFVTKITAIK